MSIAQKLKESRDELMRRLNEPQKWLVGYGPVLLCEEAAHEIQRQQAHSDLAQVHIDSLSARLLLLTSISERIFASAESSSAADFVFVHRSLIGELRRAIHHGHGTRGPADCHICFPSTSSGEPK